MNLIKSHRRLSQCELQLDPYRCKKNSTSFSHIFTIIRGSWRLSEDHGYQRIMAAVTIYRVANTGIPELLLAQLP